MSLYYGKQKHLSVVFSILRLEPLKFCLHHTCIGICVYGWITIHIIYTCTAKKAMEYERFGNCLTNARQKSQYVFGQNLTDLVYMDRCYSLLNRIHARKYLVPGVNHG